MSSNIQEASIKSPKNQQQQRDSKCKYPLSHVSSSVVLGGFQSISPHLTEGKLSASGNIRGSFSGTALALQQPKAQGKKQKNRLEKKKGSAKKPLQQANTKEKFGSAIDQFVSAVRKESFQQKNFFTLAGTDFGKLMSKETRSRQSDVHTGLVTEEDVRRKNAKFRASSGSLEATQAQQKQMFRTMDNATEFKQACIQAANYIEILQKSTKRLRNKSKKQVSAYSENCLGRIQPKKLCSDRLLSQQTRDNVLVNMIHVSKDNNFHKTPRNYQLLANNMTSPSDGRSTSHRDTHSRSSKALPLVMRHCYANNAEKRKLVEANQTAWLENKNNEQVRSVGRGGFGVNSSHRSLPGAYITSLQSSPSVFENQNSTHEVKKYLNLSVKISLHPFKDDQISPSHNAQQGFFQPPNTVQNFREAKDKAINEAITDKSPSKNYKLSDERSLTLQAVKSLKVSNKPIQKRILQSPQLATSARIKAFSPLGCKKSEHKWYIGSLMPQKASAKQSSKQASTSDQQKASQGKALAAQTNIISPIKYKRPKFSSNFNKLAAYSTKPSHSQRPQILAKKQQVSKITQQEPNSSTVQKRINLMLTQQTTQSQTPLQRSLIPQASGKQGDNRLCHKSMILSQTQVPRLSGQPASVMVSNCSISSKIDVANQQEISERVVYPPVKTLFIKHNSSSAAAKARAKIKQSQSTVILNQGLSTLKSSTVSQKQLLYPHQSKLLISSSKKPSGDNKALTGSQQRAKHPKQSQFHSQAMSSTKIAPKKQSQQGSAIGGMPSTATKASKNAYHSSANLISGGALSTPKRFEFKGHSSIKDQHIGGSYVKLLPGFSNTKYINSKAAQVSTQNKSRKHCKFNFASKEKSYQHTLYVPPMNNTMFAGIENPEKQVTVTNPSQKYQQYLITIESVEGKKHLRKKSNKSSTFNLESGISTQGQQSQISQKRSLGLNVIREGETMADGFKKFEQIDLKSKVSHASSKQGQDQLKFETRLHEPRISSIEKMRAQTLKETVQQCDQKKPESEQKKINNLLNASASKKDSNKQAALKFSNSQFLPSINDKNRIEVAFESFETIRKFQNDLPGVKVFLEPFVKDGSGPFGPIKKQKDPLIKLSSYNNQLALKEGLSLRQQEKSVVKSFDEFDKECSVASIEVSKKNQKNNERQSRLSSDEATVRNDLRLHESPKRSVSATRLVLPMCGLEVHSPDPGVSISPSLKICDEETSPHGNRSDNGEGISHKQELVSGCFYQMICTRSQPRTVDQHDPPSVIHFNTNPLKVTKQNSKQNKLIWKNVDNERQQEFQSIQPGLVHHIHKINSELTSVPHSHKESINNMSLAKTELIEFQPSNPLVILRRLQAKQNYVWLATYDEDTLHDSFMRKISYCSDQCLPWEFVPWRLFNMQLFLYNESQLCIRREPGQETLCKIYLVHINQVHDIVRYKNHMGDRKILRRQGLLSDSDPILSSKELRKKYQVTQLKIIKETCNDDSMGRGTLGMDSEGFDEWYAGIPDERQAMCNRGFNFAVTMENKKEFDDLQDVETTPMLDLIYHDQMAMGLPVLIATNRDQSKLESPISQTPSYFKHLKSLKPDLSLLIKLLQGLLQSFPDQTVEQLMYGYIEKIPGIEGKLSDEEIARVIEKSAERVSIYSELPLAKLLTPQQTSKMFELMQYNQVDPTDLQSGYQSLSLYNEQNCHCPPIERPSEDRDVVFLGAESSDLLDHQAQLPDLSQNNQLIIDQFNEDFQLQQAFDPQGASGLRQTYLPGVNSNDTSQVDNFIFQNNFIMQSNQASQDGLFNITPQRNQDPPTVKIKASCATNGISSRNGSSNAIHNPKELLQSEVTSYQGACRILNLQQPLFQENHWTQSGFDDQSNKDEIFPQLRKDEVGVGAVGVTQSTVKRGSSQRFLNMKTSPPFKPLRPPNSARKPEFFGGQQSHLVPAESISRNNNSSFKKNFHYRGYAKKAHASSTIVRDYSQDLLK